MWQFLDTWIGFVVRKAGKGYWITGGALFALQHQSILTKDFMLADCEDAETVPWWNVGLNIPQLLEYTTRLRKMTRKL